MAAYFKYQDKARLSSGIQKYFAGPIAAKYFLGIVGRKRWNATYCNGLSWILDISQPKKGIAIFETDKLKESGPI